MVVRTDNFRMKRPQKILPITKEILDYEGTWARLAPKPGDGKSQGSYPAMVRGDLFTAFQFETLLDKYQDYLDQMIDGIIEAPVPILVVSWEKALGIKRHEGTADSTETFDQETKELIPDKFTDFWDSPIIEEMRKKTVEDGGEAARDEYYKTAFYEKYADQFRDPENSNTGGINYSDKAVFTTVSLAATADYLHAHDPEKVFVDEGLAGRVNATVYSSDDSNLSALFSIISKFSHEENNQIKPSMPSEYHQPKYRYKIEGMIHNCHALKKDLEKEIKQNDNEMTVKDDRENYPDKTIGVLDWENELVASTAADLTTLEREDYEEKENSKHNKVWQAERRENKKERKKLIGLENAVKWFKKAHHNKVVYEKVDGEITKVVGSKHYLEDVDSFGQQKFLLKATYSEKWDQEVDQDIDVLMEDRSLGKTDITDFESSLKQYAYRPDKESIRRKALHTEKMKYLYEFLKRMEALKIGPKTIQRYFDKDFLTHEESVGKSLAGDYEEQYFISMTRLSAPDMVFSFAKEFGRLPEHNPNNQNVQWLEDGSLHGYHCDDLMVVWEVEVEAPLVDGLWRIIRDKNLEKESNIIGIVTKNIRQNWFGNFGVDDRKAVDGLINDFAKRDPQKAIELNQDVAYSLRDCEWTSNKGGDMKVNPEWAAEYLAYRYDRISTKLVEKFSGRKRTTCQEAIKRSDNIEKVGYGEYQFK